jgi:hypothetical protein
MQTNRVGWTGQPPKARVTVGLRKLLPPVYGTAQPPKRLSGLLRRVAYRTGEHQARHWLLLRIADRLDVIESRVDDVLARRRFLFLLLGLIPNLANAAIGRKPSV